jgi:hypothetical protein
LRLKNADQRV